MTLTSAQKRALLVGLSGALGVVSSFYPQYAVLTHWLATFSGILLGIPMPMAAEPPPPVQTVTFSMPPGPITGPIVIPSVPPAPPSGEL